MTKRKAFMQPFEALPHTLPIFPLKNAVVMPGGHLPLNIFEPRYLNMIEDAMASHHLIGMIQPRDNSTNSGLFDVGCAARISSYEETTDGRIEISLSGLCRFEIKEELTSTRGYRLVVPQWDNFKIDYEEDDSQDEVDSSFFNTLKHYFEDTRFKLDWDVMEKLNGADLYNSLYYFIDLNSDDKQMLLEINTSSERIKALTAILNNNQQVKSIKH